MAIVALVKTDLPRTQRKPLTDVVKVLYGRIVESDGEDASKKRNMAGRLGDFATTLRKTLDDQLKPHWHVLIGKNIGFACKKRNTTMGVFQIGTGKEKKSERIMVVIWKSPGIEPPDDPPPPSSATGESEEAAQPEAKNGGSTGSTAFHVVQPTKVEKDSEEETAISALRELMCQHSTCSDVQELAQIIRRKLTSELGTIWHVAAGADFVAAPAENCRNHIVASAGKTPMRVVCWQHEQVTGNMIDWKKITSAAPYAVVVFLCFAYMLFQNLCVADAVWPERELSLRESASKWLHGKVCKHPDWEVNFGTYAVGTVAVAFVGKKFFPMVKKF
mmetsp:Transcript_159831/g.298008  ORF Transcript_159831/g.298008 Transcript_159831/m.298008 type:complete len:332 (+) Transcript_159831:66-1061(+)